MKNKILLKILLIAIIVLGIGTVSSKAAISGNSQTVNSGENVTITIKSDTTLSSYKVTLTGDGGLTYESCSDSNGGQAGNKSIAGSPSNGTKTLGIFKFKAPTVTSDTKYKVTFSGTAMETPDLEEVADSSATVTVTVKAKEEVKQPENNNNNSGNSNNGSNNNGSTNNNNNQSNSSTTKSSNKELENLGIRPNDFSGFKGSETRYSANVPNNVSEVEVYAVKKESSQKISISGAGKLSKSGLTITGKVKLKEGNNSVNVVCTAEDGTTKTYTINITREKAEEQPTATETEEPQQEEPVTEEPTEEENNTTDETSNETVIGITNLTVTGKNEKGETVKLELAPDFNELVSEYSITVPLSITEVNVLAEAQDGEPTIEVMGNKDLKEGENTITVMVTVGENKKVFQITVIRTAESTTSLSNEVMLQLAIIAAIATIIIVAIIALIIMIVRNHKKKKEKYSKVDVELGDMSKLKVDEPETEQENKEE